MEVVANNSVMALMCLPLWLLPPPPHSNTQLFVYRHQVKRWLGWVSWNWILLGEYGRGDPRAKSVDKEGSEYKGRWGIGSCGVSRVEVLIKLKNHFKKEISPGWCGWVDWVLAFKQKGHRLDSQSWHIPRLLARSPAEVVWEATDHVSLAHQCFSSSLSPSLPLSLQINKSNL